MYSINVFLTFSLSMLSMWLDSRRRRRRNAGAGGAPGLFASGFVLCATILAITTVEKFAEGGWVTLAATGVVIVLCFSIRGHYESCRRRIDRLYSTLLNVPRAPEAVAPSALPPPEGPTAAVLVGEYGGVGLHTSMAALARFQGFFKGVVFLSVGVIGSREFKGEDTTDALRAHVESSLKRYVEFAQAQGIPAAYRYAIDTETVDGAAKLCLEVARDYARVTFFAGNVFFARERWYHAILHNRTAVAIQNRLQDKGFMTVLVPIRL